MKKIILSFIAIMLMVLTVPFVDAAKKTSKDTSKDTKTEEVEKEEVKEEEKTEDESEDLVTVYIFQAGGCPYCEAEIEYLKGLESYGKKFKIVTKELYVDHVDWAHGADYDLGVKVAEAFKNQGFNDASYEATPFVVISDLYAAASYNTNLESYIDKAYEKGDKDVVKCISEGKEECFSGHKYDTIIIIGIFVVLIGGIAGLVVASKKD